MLTDRQTVWLSAVELQTARCSLSHIDVHEVDHVETASRAGVSDGLSSESAQLVNSTGSLAPRWQWQTQTQRPATPESVATKQI